MSEITIEYLSSAEMENTPAAIDLETGIIYINQDLWNRFSLIEQEFILQHEAAHLYLTTYSEETADNYALLKTLDNFPGVDADLVVLNLISRLGYSQARIDNLIRSITKIKNENIMDMDVKDVRYADGFTFGGRFVSYDAAAILLVLIILTFVVWKGTRTR
jgi:hypothetical protein